jgi:uncharacterized protein (UPF0333 family)
MKAQASAEFLLIIALLSVIFAIAAGYFLGYNFTREVSSTQENYRAICSQVSLEIDYALSSGPDYERTFYLPKGNYNVSIKNYEIGVIYPGASVVCYTQINNTESLVIGKNTVIYNETGFYFR